jgi:hypothetical protein
LRQREQIAGLVGEVEPDEVAAVGPAPARALGHEALERVEHRVAPRLEQSAHALEVRLEVSAPHELVHRRLRHERRRDVGRDGERLHLCGERRGQDEVADAHARRDRLRERRCIRDVGASFQLEDRRQCRSLVAHEAVRIVLQYEQLVFSCELCDAPAALLGERSAARVLKGRDRVEEGGLLALGQRGLERVEVEAVVVHRQADDVGAEAREDLQRPVVRWRLHEDTRPFPDELLGEEHEALERAARDDDACRLDAVPRRDPLTERRIAAAGAVREHRGAVGLDRGARAVGELGDGKAFGRRNPARKRDDTHGLRLPGWPECVEVAAHVAADQHVPHLDQR